MTNSLRRINALVKKEFKDFTKNKNVSIICFLPLVYIIIFLGLGEEFENAMGSIGILNMGLGMNFTLVSTFAVSMLIAEEKEKNTLRTLMLSTVKPMEFLIGKAIVVASFTFVTNIIMYFLVGLEVEYLPHFILWSVVLMIIMILLGGVIGLIAQNQMATGVVGMPVLMGFFLLPMLAPANEVLTQIALFLPNYNFQIIITEILDGQEYSNLFNNILTLIIWVFVSIIIFAYTYNKKGLDQ